MAADPSFLFLSALTRAYHRLSDVSDRLHAQHGISAATRSILLLLHARGPATLSDIARDRAVSRQFIQRSAAPLVRDGLVEPLANPRSRRSPLLSLTARGQNVVDGILAREQPLRATIAELVPAEDIARAADALARLDAALKTAEALAALALAAGMKADITPDLDAALRGVAGPARVLIGGSLHLAGEALRANGT